LSLSTEGLIFFFRGMCGGGEAAGMVSCPGLLLLMAR